MYPRLIDSRQLQANEPWVGQMEPTVMRFCAEGCWIWPRGTEYLNCMSKREQILKTGTPNSSPALARCGSFMEKAQTPPEEASADWATSRWQEARVGQEAPAEVMSRLRSTDYPQFCGPREGCGRRKRSLSLAFAPRRNRQVWMEHPLFAPEASKRCLLAATPPHR